MKIAKLASIGIVLIIALTIVVAIMAGGLTTIHAAESTTSKVRVPQFTIPPNLPAALTVPAGNVPIAQFFGTGVLTFACPTSAASVEVPTIVISQAAGGPSAGTHFQDNAGLVWEALNGDKVTAAPVAKATVVAGNAPWVLLKATAHQGNALFTQVTFILRFNTNGGLPPATPCVANQAEVEVPFTTQYLFFGAA